MLFFVSSYNMHFRSQSQDLEKKLQEKEVETEKYRKFYFIKTGNKTINDKSLADALEEGRTLPRAKVSIMIMVQFSIGFVAAQLSVCLQQLVPLLSFSCILSVVHGSPASARPFFLLFVEWG